MRQTTPTWNAPVGKLHTDRYVPLHPSLIELHRAWLDWNGPTTPAG